MMNIRFALRPVAALLVCARFLTGCSEPDGETPQPQATQLYMDVHDLGPGNVKAEGVAKAHAADLSVQQRHGVQFIRYWVDEQHGKVYCLSRAPGPEAIVETHREAHGLLPDTVGLVSEGQ
jgi:hypothetical protein